jgi:HEAT repeat protein
MNCSIAFQNFISAVDIDNDEQTEQLATRLTVTDEPDLLRLLSNADANRRWWAVRALALCGTQTAIPGLQSALTDEDATLRAAAALTLSHLYTRTPDAVRPLLDRLAAKLADDEGVVRQAVTDALIMCGDDAVPALTQV